MSRENVELARAAYDALNRGDIEAVLASFHPDIDFVTSGVFPGLHPVYSGHDGFRRAWRDFAGTWDSILISIQELRDCGERLLALVTFEARGREGLEVRRQSGSVWTFRDGKVVRIENQGSWTEALEAAGLREQPMAQENVEIVRRALAAWNRQDLEGLLALMGPDPEYVNSPTAVEPGTRRGTGEVTAVIRGLWESLADVRWEIDRLWDRGEGVIALGRMSRRMPGSDARIEDRSLVSYTIRNGKIVRFEVLGFGIAEVRKALEAAELRE